MRGTSGVWSFLLGVKPKNTMVSNYKKQRGFTLIEILVVIGIIAILAAIVIVAINPARQFAQARNTQRESNLNTLLNAVGQRLADNKGIFTCTGLGTIPVVTPMNPASGRNIGTPSGATIVDLGCLVPTYIPSTIPMDPTNGTAADTGYTLQVDSLGRYTVCAPGSSEAALGSPAPLCVTR